MVVWPIDLTHLLSAQGTPTRACNQKQQALVLSWGDMSQCGIGTEGLVNFIIARYPASATVQN